MIALYIHIVLVLCFILTLAFGSNSRNPFMQITVTDLLFKTYMVRPDSWIHALFIRKNTKKNYPHLVHNAVFVIASWLYCIANTVIVSLSVYCEQTGRDATVMNAVAYSLIGLYLLIEVAVNFALVIRSREIAYIQSLMSDEERKKLHEELEEKVPGFYKGCKGLN